MNRRLFLQCGYAGMIAGWTPAIGLASEIKSFQIKATAGETNIVGPDFPATPIWGFDGKVPGSPIRVVRGESLDVTIANSLQVPTSVHWHGIRLPNNMDGVAGLTQKPIKPGESFRYHFMPPDSGSYWYHSHVNAHEQIGRGLYGPLIVEEPEPPVVDRDLIWMIDDWRLSDDASIVEDFESGHDRSHAGRTGNVPTVNGRFRDVVKVRTGERIRLRLINASNARNFALSFGELKPSVIAVDGQAVKPYTVEESVVIGASGRVDLMLDLTGDPGSVTPVVDNFYRQSYELTKFIFEDKPLRASTLTSSIDLQAPEIPEPDLANAITHNITVAGGAMGGLARAKLNGEWMDLRDIARQGYVWAMNDTVGNRVDMPAIIEAQHGTTIRLNLHNNTSFPHPMHLHGYHMKLLSIDGEQIAEPYWVDSPLLMPRQKMELAFVADNPGKWLFHCHVLEHHAAGLGALVHVT